MSSDQLTDLVPPLAALSSTYDQCKGILRSVGHEWNFSNDAQKSLQARIQTEHQLLEQWGYRVGLDGPDSAQLSATSNAYLLDRDFHENTQEILESIVEVFEQTVAELAHHYAPPHAPISQPATINGREAAGASHKGYLARIQSFLSAKNPTSRWHRKDKIRFDAFVDTVHYHVGVLQKKLDYFESVAGAKNDMGRYGTTR